MAETTKCITTMLGTRGVSGLVWILPIGGPAWMQTSGNTDFEVSNISGNAGKLIISHSYSPNAYHTSSYGSPVPTGNEAIIGKEGKHLGHYNYPQQYSSLANRCVQFAAGRIAANQGSSVYTRVGIPTSTGTNMGGAWPQRLSTMNHNNHSSVNGSGHFQSSFYKKTAYPNYSGGSKAYVIDSSIIHLGATDHGSNQSTFFVR